MDKSYIAYKRHGVSIHDDGDIAFFDQFDDGYSFWLEGTTHNVYRNNDEL